MAMEPASSEGTVAFSVPAAGKECFTWYKVFGSLESTTTTPLVLVHGGPGLSHDYMLSLLPLHTQFGIPLILYDQLGNGRSTHLPEKKGDESFWVEELFVQELNNLTAKLGLDDRPGGFDLLGHSWGGMMGATWAGRRPGGLRRLVISNSPAEDEEWLKAYRKYRSALPQAIQDAMTKHEEAGTTNSSEYQGIMINEFYRRHMCSVLPWPAEFTRSFEWADKDGTVAETMNGTSEFEVTGTMKDWSAAESAKTIEAETLVINGTDEGASDESVRPFVEGIKNVTWVKLTDSRHMPMYEEKEKYFNLVSKFLLRK